jgi:hypothetical protein
MTYYEYPQTIAEKTIQFAVEDQLKYYFAQQFKQIEQLPDENLVKFLEEGNGEEILTAAFSEERRYIGFDLRINPIIDDADDCFVFPYSSTSPEIYKWTVKHVELYTQSIVDKQKGTDLANNPEFIAQVIERAEKLYIHEACHAQKMVELIKARSVDPDYEPQVHIAVRVAATRTESRGLAITFGGYSGPSEVITLEEYARMVMAPHTSGLSRLGRSDLAFLINTRDEIVSYVGAENIKGYDFNGNESHRQLFWEIDEVISLYPPLESVISW